MFLVGGFAESAMLQQAMRKNFGHLVKILIPYDVSLAILKGQIYDIWLINNWMLLIAFFPPIWEL